MKIAVIGGTGLLGLAGSTELISRGHTVKSLAHEHPSKEVNIPKEMEIVTGDYTTMSDEKLREFFKDCEAFVFAAGVDERTQAKPGEPVYKMFKKYNIDPLDKIFPIINEIGIKKVVILGSYFSYFAKKWEELKLTKHHPNIRSRIVQEELVLSYAKKYNMDVSILELPYIFGTQKGRKPVWLFIAKMIKNSRGKCIPYPKGGTTMVTVKQVGQAIAGALEKNKGANTYPVGWYNMSWKQWLEIFSEGMNCKKSVITIPTFMYNIFAKKLAKGFKDRNIETGLEMKEFSKIMTANTFIDKDIIERELGVKPDDIEKAIKESAKLCLDILNDKAKK
jgi:nucleoside-diphosphate-sugar epimerase